ITFYTDSSGEVAWLSMALEPAVGDIEFDHLPIVREYVVLRAAGPISVDGKLDDRAWKRAPYTEDFVAIGTGAPAERRTRAKMLWTDTHWYLAWTMDDPDIQGEMTEHDDDVWREDSIELFMDPDDNGRNYAQIVVNPLGTVLDLTMNRPFYAGGFGDDTWTLEGLQVAVQIDGTVGDAARKDKSWVCEMAIPFGALESAAPSMAFPPASADEWRVNLCRSERDTRSEEDELAHTAWSRTDGRDFHVPERFGRITFSDEVAE
ncbi:carbohydrate-binding family 9-like protein, partial [Candidatus Latescibacterota bacterium]